MTPQWREVRVTRKQARAMAEAIWRLQQRVEQYAEIGHIDNYSTVKDQIALAEIRRRLYVAADTRED